MRLWKASTQGNALPMVMSPSDAPAVGSAIDRACARLRQLVTLGRLAGGQPLIETELCQTLQVSRGTVREALRRLQSEGLLVARARGLQLRRLSKRDVEDLYELRASLEGLAARRAAAQVASDTTDHADALTQEVNLWESIGKASSMAAFSEQNRRFHALIVTVSGNTHLPRMLDQTLLALFAGQFRGWLAPESMQAAIADHLAVLQAVAEGSEARAEKAMRKHIRDSATAILALPGDAFS